MPRGDGTGPMGRGPMTGRAAGYCAGYAVPGFANPQGGRLYGLRYPVSGYARGMAAPIARPGFVGRGLGMAWGRGGRGGLGMAWGRGGRGGFGRGRGRAW
ncbi:MAG: DUF5320 domain-containing protein [Armatimonadetes bacterium]|nr:DUF5320 domain-containing protein [Armatimonadota bacterium]